MLWCYACLMLILPVLCRTQNDPGYFITSPDVLRVGVSETVLVSLRNTGPSAIPVTLLLQSFPTKDVTYAQETIQVEANQPQTATLRINPTDVPAVDRGVKQHAFLVAKSQSAILPFQSERMILMSYKSGYVFIQTDKPIYTPDHDVKIRIISLNQTMRPSDMPIRLEIRNPQDLIVKLVESVQSDTGLITETFHFPTHPLFGNWSVVAYYGHKHQYNTTVQFFVKEYVLPTFSVKIVPQSNYILPQTSTVISTISADYVFGEPVQGSYHVKYSVLLPSGELRYVKTDSGQLDAHGEAFPALDTSHLPFNWFDQYVGSRFHIQAFVTEESSGVTEYANNTQVLFVRSPYVIKWDHTAKFFKKDLPFEVKASVFHANGQPAAQVPINIIAEATTAAGTVLLAGEKGDLSQKVSNHYGHVKYSLNVPADTTLINITLETSDSDIAFDQNARTSFLINPQQSPSGTSFLLARIRSDRINVGNTVAVDLQKTGDNSLSTFHLMVISGGQIVAHKTVTSGNKNVVMNLDVTVDMVPHARLLVYFIDGQNQVIADSLWFDVINSCGANTVSVSVPHWILNQKYQPGDQLNLQVEGQPGTKVGLLAVDSAVYMLKDYHRLTAEKMFKTMEEYDIGCGPGGGKNVQAIFKDTGVAVITNANLALPPREDESCVPSSRRKRRSIGDLPEISFDDPTLQYYCDEGKKLNDGNEKPCSVRAQELADLEMVSVDDSHIQAYYNCCQDAANDDRGRSGSASAVPGDFNPSDDTQTNIRSFFPETWIFDEVEIGPFGQTTHRTSTPDTITTWIIQAVGVSPTHGMCVADPLPLRVQPDFFIIMHLPYSVIRLEQVEIVATIFNYHSQNLSVRVFLRGVDGVCSESQPGEYSQPRDFDIRPKDSITVKYNIVPLRIGEFPLEIFVATARGNDAVIKMLKVVPEGVKRERTIPVTLDPSGARRQLQSARQVGRSSSDTVINSFQHDQIRNEAEARQLDHIYLDMPPGYVPDSSSVSVNIIGNLMGSAVTTVIEGLDNLLEMPRGCGEQTMLYMAPNVYILKYLKETDQITPEIEQVVFRYIEEGITRQLSHRRDDGSFAIWGDNTNYPSSTWLTAFVNKVFCQAKEFTFIDPKITCKAIDWLVNNAQQPDGSFRELYKVHHKEMTGGLEGDATMTAFVLISLLECDCSDVWSEDAVANAKVYLENAVSTLQRPYEMAVVTYALVLAGSTNAQQASLQMKAVSTYDPERSTRYWQADASSLDQTQIPYWYEYRPSAISVESTAYALLALLRLGEISYTHPIVNWLTEQRNYNGGFVSTQDTVIALQALSEYAIQTSGEDVALECILSNDLDASYRETVTLHSHNALVQQSLKGPKTGKLIVETTGTGVGQLAVQVKYHTVDDYRERCPFDVVINAREARSGTIEDPVLIEDDLPSRSRVGHTDDNARVGRRRRDSRSRIGTVADTDDRGRATSVEERGRAKGDFVAEVHVCAINIGIEITNMAIIDVGLYSGFKPVKESLERLLEPPTLIRRYEISDRAVIFYVDEIPRDRQVCVRFQVIREYVVGKIQPVAVRVYDYYSPEKECISFYHPTAPSTLLSTVCEGSTCLCAAGNCPKRACAAHECTTTYDELLGEICNKANTFAYRVSFRRKRESAGFEINELNILSVFAIGDDRALENSFIADPSRPVVREFWKSLNCHELQIGSKRQYLVIGTGGIRYQDENGQDSYKYILDDTFIFEDWPFDKRATKPRFNAQVAKLERLRTQMERPQGGCLT